jgi:NAD(P)H-dependent FMN reductase
MIRIISASVRDGRASHRVALYFEKYIRENNIGEVEILDLLSYQFPVFNERLEYQHKPAEKVLEFANKIKEAEAVIIVTPEYNGGYPASLKNVIDLLYAEWYHKPLSVVTVSDGSFGGTQVITSLLFTLWKIKAWVVPAMFPVPKVHEAFDESGNPTDKVATDKRAHIFLSELIWCVTAKSKMK